MSKSTELSPVTGVTLHPTALVFEKQVTFEEWSKVFGELRRMKGALLWWIGDALNYGEGTFGERYAQVIDPTDYELETLRVAAWVCAKVPLSRRHTDVPFSIYKMLAKFEDKQQMALVDKIRSEKMTVRETAQLLIKKQDKSKGKGASDAVPVRALDAVTTFCVELRDMLEELPPEKWEQESMAVVHAAFDSMVLETRRTFGWQ